MLSGVRVIDAQVFVDRRNAPVSNSRLLPHNMQVYFEVSDDASDEHALRVVELGGNFAMTVVMLSADACKFAGQSLSSIEALADSVAALDAQVETLTAKNAKLTEALETKEATVNDLEEVVVTLEAQIRRVAARTLDWDPESE